MTQAEAVSWPTNISPSLTGQPVSAPHSPYLVDMALDKAPLVSVIVTVYKRTQYLLKALDSACRQIYPNVEIIVIDDSGTALARPLVNAQGYEAVRYFANPATLGVASSLVRAVKQANGEL